MTLKQRGWYYVAMEVFAKTEDKTPVKTPIFENKIEETENTKSESFKSKLGVGFKAFAETEIDNQKDESLDDSKNEKVTIFEDSEILGASQKGIVFFGVYLERDICTVFKLEKLRIN